MLAYVLAFVVGLGSLAIYIAAFFFPEIHRKNDFIWSGVGLFYALVLWVFAPRISGGLLLGHVASVALLISFGWQTLSLRRQLTPQTEQTPVPSPQTVKTGIQEQMNKLSLQERLGQVQGSMGNILSSAKNKAQQTITKKTPETPKTEETTSATPQKPAVEIIDKTSATPEAPAEEKVATTATESQAEEVTPPNPPPAEVVEAAQAEAETEEKPPIPAEEIARDAALAPPAEAPPEKIPPNDQAG
ncbi:Ycf66 family protein [Nodularia spumigena CS-591/12]|uniref:Ycf66 family protein n=1 Tax=Nodularia spumigena TaxID=70799 RepID=UPI00232CED11|nr:Ycf66 family protein [Nodularia spumigena]MDB9305080.1 Ycf66 family protein [Nodularia spumigena CS-591/12]MDB9342595.1 Ycf66 family protein [Nodularia spumigena CS-588/06]MDB9349124.1 Ycf66 family protein [Nodularia spumigena CS-588/01]MDB9351222.1 Ycf66 family protein [Nodularia spumigena CS-588/05]MDB9367988.1 Ycf66 family protein [Nodularia spumigena CS-586/05]